jgi:hypothetical protein
VRAATIVFSAGKSTPAIRANLHHLPFVDGISLDEQCLPEIPLFIRAQQATGLA